jgi:hypothetical protein
VSQTSRAGAGHHHPQYATVGHHHDGRYALEGHDHDDVYYTQAEVDALLADKADASTQPVWRIATSTVTGGSGVATFSHTLGAVPNVVLATHETPAGVRVHRVTNKTATHVDIQFRDNGSSALAADLTIVTIGLVCYP